MDENEIAKKVEHLFEPGGDDDQMWRIISKFAAQYDEQQMLGITKLTYVANICSEKIRNRLLAFLEQYKQLCNNRNTALFMLKMKEMDSLKNFIHEIKGQVLVNK